MVVDTAYNRSVFDTHGAEFDIDDAEMEDTENEMHGGSVVKAKCLADRYLSV